MIAELNKTAIEDFAARARYLIERRLAARLCTTHQAKTERDLLSEISMWVFRGADVYGMFGSENEVVAVCVVTWPKTQPVNVRVIYTLPYARRQGHMSKLLAFVEQAAKDRGYQELASRASTFESRALYERRGYRVDTTTKEGHKLIKTRLKR